MHAFPWQPHLKATLAQGPDPIGSQIPGKKRFQPTMKNLYKQMSLYNIIVTCILIYRNNFSAKSSRIRFKTYLLIENLC